MSSWRGKSNWELAVQRVMGLAMLHLQEAGSPAGSLSCSKCHDSRVTGCATACPPTQWQSFTACCSPALVLGEHRLVANTLREAMLLHCHALCMREQAQSPSLHPDASGVLQVQQCQACKFYLL